MSESIEENMAEPSAVSIPVAMRRYSLKPSFGYELNRYGRLPGAFRVGRLVRVDLQEFERALKAGEIGSAYLS